MAIDRKAMFAAAKEKRKQEIEESKNRGSWSGEYDTTYWCALQNDTCRVLRILSNPLSDRQTPYDMKKINVSRIKADNGGMTYIIFPDHKTNADWILWRIYDLVTKGVLVGSGKSRHKVFDYQDSHPECFRRVVYNDRENNQYEKGWTPQARIIMNIIDRHDPEFHKNTKHSKLLSSKASEIQDKPGNFFYDWGVPSACYNHIWDEVVEYNGDWADYDIAIKKTDSEPYYIAYHGVDDAKKIGDAAKYVVDGPLTKEEESLELYNLDEMFNVTSYTKIKAKLGNFIKKVDTDFNVNFTKELEALVEKEQAQWKAEGKNQFGYKPSETKTSAKQEVIEEDVEADLAPYAKEEETYETKRITNEAEPVRVRRSSIDWDALYNGSFNGVKYLGVPEMTDEEKAMVISVKDDGSFVYESGHEILKNTKNQFMSPSEFHVDPLSGEIFN